jgi:hypothetical protein
VRYCSNGRAVHCRRRPQRLQRHGAGTDKNAGDVATPRVGLLAQTIPGKHGTLGKADVETDLLNGRDLAVFLHAVDTQDASEVDHCSNDKAYGWRRRGIRARRAVPFGCLLRLATLEAEQRTVVA